MNNVPVTVITNGINVFGYHYTGQKGLNLVTRFTDLKDTPNTYFGQSEKVLKVKTDESGIEFVSLNNTNISISNDSTPTLGGDLDISGCKLYTTNNKDIRIMASGNVIIQGLVYPNVGGKPGQVLGIQSGQLVWVDKLSALLEDNTPKLGGNLNVNGNSIFSDIKFNIYTNANGSLQLEGFTWPKIDGGKGQVLTTDGSKKLTWEDLPVFDHLISDLVVDGYRIITSNGSNKNIYIKPDGSGNIILDKLIWPKTIGIANQLLSTDGNGNLIWANSNVVGIKTIYEDKTPKLGGDLNVNGNLIYSDSLFNIYTTSLGSLQLEGFTWPKIDGGKGQVLTTDGTKTLTWQDLPNFSQSFKLQTDLITDGFKITTTNNNPLNITPTGNLILGKLTWPNTIGIVNQILSTDGHGNIIWIDQISGIKSVNEDNTPKLGGDLNTNNHSIYSDSNLNIFTNALGSLKIEGFMWPKIAGGKGQVLATNGTKSLFWQDMPDISQNFKLQTDLIVNNYKITSTNNNSISIIPNGTGNLILDKLIWPKTIGNANQLLSTDGLGNLTWIDSGGIKSVYDDVVPKLGGNLNTNSFSIYSDSNLNIFTNIMGSLQLEGFTWPKIDGNVGQILTTNGSKKLYWQDLPTFKQSYILSENFIVDDYEITTTHNKSINIVPNGTGNLILDKLIWPKTIGNINQVLSSDGLGNLIWNNVNSGIKSISEDKNPQLGGNLDTTGYKITSLVDIKFSSGGSIILNSLTFPRQDGNNGQVLTTNGSGVLIWTDADLLFTKHLPTKILSNVSDDNSPRLGGDLDLNGHTIISHGDIILKPAVNNTVVLNNFRIPYNDGTLGQVLTTNGNGILSWTTPAVNATGITKLQDDISPKLGGNLDVSNYNIKGTTDFGINVNGKLYFNHSQWPVTFGSSGQFLTTDGNGILSWTTNFVSNDTNPTLSGNLNVNGKNITGTTVTLQSTQHIILDGLKWPHQDGANTQALSTDGNGNLNWIDVVTKTYVSSDTNPSLGGDLNVSDFSIVSSNNKNLNLKSGQGSHIVLDGISWPKTSGTLNQVLTIDSNKNLIWTTIPPFTLVSDTSPMLGGDLNVNSHSIVGNNVVITSTNNLILNGLKYPSIDGVMGAYLSTDGNKNIQWNSIELAPIHIINDVSPKLGGNLDINNHSITSMNDINIVASNNIILNGMSWPRIDGTQGQSLFTDGHGDLYWADVLTTTGTISVVNDTSPILGGNLNVNNFKILAPLNKDIVLETAGIGKIVLDGIRWPNNDSAQGQVLTTNGNGSLVWDSRLQAISQDVYPKLGGDLNTDGYMIHAPNGKNLVLSSTTGNIILNGQKWPNSSGIDGQLLTTDLHGNLSWKTYNSATNLSTDLNPTLSGDLNVNGYNIVSNENLNITTPGLLTLNGVTWPTLLSNVPSGAVLTYNGNNLTYWDSGLLRNIIQDTKPQLGGNLILDNYKITNVPNKNIIIDTTGNGNVLINGLTFPKDTGNVGDVLTSTGTGLLYWKGVSNYSLSADTNPTLAGPLNVGDFPIISGGNISINAGEHLYIQGLAWPSGGNPNDV